MARRLDQTACEAAEAENRCSTMRTVPIWDKGIARSNQLREYVMQNIVDVAIVGAGPYGLSLAAHLAAAGTSFRILGKPMSTWRDHMPKGMQLKSDGFASNLSAPDPESTLKAWSAERGIEYDDLYIPVKL